MYEQVEKPKEKSRVVANSVSQKKSDGKQGFGFVDNRSEFALQRKLRTQANEAGLVIQRVWQAATGKKNAYNDLETGAMYDSSTRKYSGPEPGNTESWWINKTLDSTLHASLMACINTDTAPPPPVVLPPQIVNALKDASSVSLKTPTIEVYLDNDQLKHQNSAHPIGTRKTGSGNTFTSIYGSSAWHQSNTMVHMQTWASNLVMNDGEQKYHGQSTAVDEIHYEGYCMQHNGVKYVLFHCYPANGSKMTYVHVAGTKKGN